MIKFDVSMFEIPMVNGSAAQEIGYSNLTAAQHGKDVVINWDFVDFNGNNELWYDANGL
jgi:hypothetical protein